MSSICRYKKFFLFFFSFWFLNTVTGQDYRAMHGSSYGGSLSVANSPASIVHVPYVFDFTPLAFQFKQSTNAFVVNNSSYLSLENDKTEININNGRYKSFLKANQDLRLLNTSIRIGTNSAFAFGASIRSYISANTSSLVFHDSTGTFREFMGNNIRNIPASAKGRGHVWTEIFGTYARTLFDKGDAILNAGITVKSNMGIAAGYATTTDLNLMAGAVNNKPGYYLTSGLSNYGYSSNLSVLDTATTFASAKKSYFKNSFSTIGISLGAEYIIPDIVKVNGNGYDYNFKLGVSLLDLAANRFQYSAYSRSAIHDKNNVSDSLLQNFFDNVSDAPSLADSLHLISGSNSPLAGKFNIFQPARMVINADKRINENIFINVELTIPIHALIDKSRLIARDMNFLNIAARYETKQLGIYFPASLNDKMHFWFGGAFRVGSLLLGVHNWASVFGKNKIQEGGGYLAFTFRFGEKNRISESKDPRNSNKVLRQLICSPFVL